MAAQDLRVGERVQELDGSVGVVIAVTSTPGDAVRYNLTVHELHTYAVGDGQWVVHNCGGQVEYGSTDLSKRAQDARKAAGDRTGNYAAATLDDGSTIVGRSTAEKHAEEVLFDRADAQGKKIAELYSEYEPCARKCAPALANRGITSVTWSFAWNGATTAETAAIRAASRIAVKTAIRGLFG